ncbi:ferrochelatase [Opitutus sp. GAS368]|uniref:ferrochelatase n=1 Tax=Opitutus sp. GAS368 TaxID=1882749 RepID=UPI00087A8A1C|nr:ferrochelatase [Opitutus sp. GAS368]SDS43536.1 ferrochelatase [Opitutus sp. GAS368]
MKTSDSSLDFPRRARAVLLVNLGSPETPSVPEVRRYLREFLGDERVLDLPAPLRWLLLEGVILPTRPKKSAHAYASIWTPEGSPLIRTSLSVQRKLAAVVDPDLPVYLAMRYGLPSIASVVDRMATEGIEEVLLIPQYPHYAMSSWETVVVRVREEAARRDPGMVIDCVAPFYADSDYIEALHAASRPWLVEPHDHVLFSYHGIPLRHLRKADSSHAHCQCTAHCCTVPSPAHATCYRAQVMATTRAFAARAGLVAGSYSVSFQSRLAGEPWCEPFTDHELRRLPAAGVKRLLVLCPAFVADCLETLEEIAVEGRATFLAAGGESFQLIPCLNDQSPYIEFLAGRVARWQGVSEPAVARPRFADAISA